MCEGLSSCYREHQLRTRGALEEIQRVLQQRGPPPRSLYAPFCHQKEDHPWSSEYQRPSINTHTHTHTLTPSMYMWAQPCIHMCPQKAQACVRLPSLPHQDQFPSAVCVRERDRCCAGRVTPPVHYRWQRCRHEHEEPRPADALLSRL